MNRATLACMLLGIFAGCAQVEPAPLRVNQRAAEARAAVFEAPSEQELAAIAAEPGEASPRTGESSEPSASIEQPEPTAFSTDESPGMVRKAPTPQDSGARVRVRSAPSHAPTEREPGSVPAPSMGAEDMRDPRRDQFARRQKERSGP